MKRSLANQSVLPCLSENPNKVKVGILVSQGSVIRYYSADFTEFTSAVFAARKQLHILNVSEHFLPHNKRTCGEGRGDFL